MSYKQVIDGLTYNTETAEKVCELDCRHERGDFAWHDTALYQTKKGRFFLAGEGNARSMWAHPVGNNGSTSGSGLRPVSEAEAKQIIEEQKDPALYERVFGVAEDA